MPVFNNILAGASGQGDTGYDIEHSLRFDDASSALLSRTPGSEGNRRTWSLSFWRKQESGANTEPVMSCGSYSGGITTVYFNANGSLSIADYSSSTYNVKVYTDAKYKDPSSWAHFLVVFDSTNSTATDRVRIYKDGTRVTDFETPGDSDTMPSLNFDSEFNTTALHMIGRDGTGSSDYGRGYLAEMHFLDGTALSDASAFGETNSSTNQWVPIEVTGLTYGTNGFYLKFQDSSALGDDSSGNTNDFSVTNLAATDQMLDSPTNNFCTLNPLNPVTGTFSEGNLKYAGPGGWNQCVKSTMEIPNTGKWGFRVDYSGNASGSAEGSVFTLVGVCKTSQTAFTGGPDFSEGLWYSDSGYVYNFSSTAQTETAISNGDYVEMLIDSDANSYIFKLNGTSVNNGTIGTTDPISVVIQQYNNSYANPEFDFGQRGYEPSDSDYKTLCTDNLPDPAIADSTAHFDTTLVSGNGSNRSITGLNFQPDFLWGKSRTNTLNHYLTDSVRGVNSQLYSDGTGAQGTETVIYTAFNSDGFSLGTGDMNTSGQNYVHWAWKGGGTASTNENGTIDSSVSANTTAGFSIVSWTGTGSNVTVGHGLSQAPELVINKSRGDAYNFAVQSFLWNSASDTNILYLNTTAAQADDTNVFQAAPTSTVFSPQGGAWGGIGTNTIQYIAYCFHSVDGYSKIGKYTGNGSTDGTFVYTGFRPAFVMIKRYDSSSGANWILLDSKRDTFNAVEDSIYANLNNAEDDTDRLDFVSNGFKLRQNGTTVNTSSGTYIYLAIAESPFKTSNAR